MYSSSLFSPNAAPGSHQHGAPEHEAAQVPEVRLRGRVQVVPADAPEAPAPRLRALQLRHHQQVQDGQACQGG